MCQREGGSLNPIINKIHRNTHAPYRLQAAAETSISFIHSSTFSVSLFSDMIQHFIVFLRELTVFLIVECISMMPKPVVKTPPATPTRHIAAPALAPATPTRHIAAPALAPATPTRHIAAPALAPATPTRRKCSRWASTPNRSCRPPPAAGECRRTSSRGGCREISRNTKHVSECGDTESGSAAEHHMT